MSDESHADPEIFLVTMEEDRRVSMIEGQPPEAALRSPRTSLFTIFCPATATMRARGYLFTTRRASVNDSFDVAIDAGTLRIVDKEGGALLMAFAPGMWGTFQSAAILEGRYAIRVGATTGSDAGSMKKTLIRVRDLQLRIAEGMHPWRESTRYDTGDCCTDR
ncbi:hypothetical protein [Ornithinimicrobium pratense]|uniref:Uncharacterized protein n=1 Tax=Ornithinimicrobium pratense TaxID=2593973 RepID=A0A5J6V4H7_9MICO|nr:hypothetical protein [Ornithinimicrobium pratense]QFG68204.1 hypothetical protein FY030_05280 [Ornithinimicrobium pratense]